jgi:glycosyltransferase involved in cell wall biosynthesis
MACGCPAIISNTTSLPEVGGDAAWYVDPHDSRSMAQGLEAVLTDAALRKDLIQRGLARARLFSWEEAAGQLLQVFEEVGGCAVARE